MFLSTGTLLQTLSGYAQSFEPHCLLVFVKPYHFCFLSLKHLIPHVDTPYLKALANDFTLTVTVYMNLSSRHIENDTC